MTNDTPDNYANESTVRRLRGWLSNATDTEVQELLITSSESAEDSPREPIMVTLPAPATSPTHVTYLDQSIPERHRYRRQNHEASNQLPTQEMSALFVHGGGVEEIICIGGRTNVYYFPDMPGR